MYCSIAELRTSAGTWFVGDSARFVVASDLIFVLYECGKLVGCALVQHSQVPQILNTKP